MTAPNLVRALERLTAVLDAAQIDYAIGGAVALAFWTAPRATVDIDISVDVDGLRLPYLLSKLADAGPADDWRVLRYREILARI